MSCTTTQNRIGYERIGIAVSDDMLNWKRYGKDAVIDNGKGLSETSNCENRRRGLCFISSWLTKADRAHLTHSHVPTI
ncbi:MAG: hypothetical protein ACLUKN_07880 [Bacilli bacterium]